MELWLDVLNLETPSSVDSSDFSSAVDLRFGEDFNSIDGRILDREGKTIGAHFLIDDPNGQNDARSAIGSVEWILVECSDWTIIPLENLIADSEGTPTSIAVRIDDPKLISGAAFALDIGVDAILLKDNLELWEIGSICKSQRLEIAQEDSEVGVSEEKFELVPIKVTSIEEGGVGDRVCVDLVGMLENGEGLLVGSSSKMMALVHAETIASGYVSPRPFRVNAGAVHSYSMLADGRTCYLSEIASGDQVLICNANGNTRTMTVGRVKIEQRPMLNLKMEDENAHTGNVYLQQAETVRLVTPQGNAVSITELQNNDYILGNVETTGRHVGVAISAKVVER